MGGMLELTKYGTLAIKFSIHEHWKGCEVSSGVILEVLGENLIYNSVKNRFYLLESLKIRLVS